MVLQFHHLAHCLEQNQVYACIKCLLVLQTTLHRAYTVIFKTLQTQDIEKLKMFCNACSYLENLSRLKEAALRVASVNFLNASPT